MPRLTNLNDIMFPLEEHPVFVSIASQKKELRQSMRHCLRTISHFILAIFSRSCNIHAVSSGKIKTSIEVESLYCKI